MNKHNKLLDVIIPLRSKSKSIKNKNFLKVGKFPLAVRCINTVLKSKIANNINVPKKFSNPLLQERAEDLSINKIVMLYNLINNYG